MVLERRGGAFGADVLILHIPRTTPGRYDTATLFQRCTYGQSRTHGLFHRSRLEGWLLDGQLQRI